MLAQRTINIFTNLTTKTPIKTPIFLSSMKKHKSFSFFPKLRSSDPVSPGGIGVSLSSKTRRKGSTLSFAFWGNCEDEGFGIVEEEEEGLVGHSTGFGTNQIVLARINYALNRVSKWLVVTLFWAVIFWKPEARSLWAIVGNFMNLLISTTLKHIVKQKRPVPGLRMDPGMPSSHAQSFFFTIPFAIMSLVEHLGLNTLSLTIGGLAMASASYLSLLRVSHRLHTISQVVAGAISGLSFCLLWFWWWDAMVQEAFCSNLWIRILVISLVTFFCSTFVVYVIQSVLQFKSKLQNDFKK